MAWGGWIARVGAEVGLPGLALDTGGRLRLVFDELPPVDFAAAADGSLTLRAELGRVPDFAREETLAALLAASGPDGPLEGAALGLDATRERVWLSRRLDAGTEGEAATSALEAFLAGAAAWAGRLEAAEA